MAMDLRKLIEDSKILLDALADAVCIKDSDGEAVLSRRSMGFLLVFPKAAYTASWARTVPARARCYGS